MTTVSEGNSGSTASPAQTPTISRYVHGEPETELSSELNIVGAPGPSSVAVWTEVGRQPHAPPAPARGRPAPRIPRNGRLAGRIRRARPGPVRRPGLDDRRGADRRLHECRVAGADPVDRGDALLQPLSSQAVAQGC